MLKKNNQETDRRQDDQCTMSYIPGVWGTDGAEQTTQTSTSCHSQHTPVGSRLTAEDLTVCTSLSPASIYSRLQNYNWQQM